MNITRLRPIKLDAASSVASGRRAGRHHVVRPEAAVLLAEILARLQGVELPIVQFMPACSAGADVHVARAFAAAAVARFGRTLLLDGTAREGSLEKPSLCRSNSRRQRRPTAVMPDTEIVGLYHRLASDASLDKIAIEAPDAQPFRMIVVQSSVPTSCPSGLNRARQCNGSVLTVAAGLTSLSNVQATVRQLRHAGGTLLGAVLFDAPSIWLSN